MILAEQIMEQHCRCHWCKREWIVNKPTVYGWETSCCGWTTVREVPGQILFSDAGGAWLRMKARAA